MMTAEERYLHNRQFDTPGGGEALTKQADKDSADINIIVKTYGTSNEFANVNPMTPRYQDNTEVMDLIQAKNLWNEAVSEFEKLPAEVRALANNDPIVFLDMLTDEDAVAALKKRGLPIKEVEPPDARTLLEGIHGALTAPKETEPKPE